MLENKDVQALVEQREYVKVFNYFHKEYTNTLKEFLIRHNVSISEKDCLINYIIKTRMFMPRYKKYTLLITNVYNEEISEEEKLGVLMSSYTDVKRVFSE